MTDSFLPRIYPGERTFLRNPNHNLLLMITVTEIKRQADGWYKNYLVAWLRDETMPLEIRFGKVKTAGILEDFAALDQAIKNLKKESKEELGFGYTVEFKETATRKAGRQWLPARIFFETPEDYLKFIRKDKAFRAFTQSVALVRREMPALEAWLAEHPLKVIENAGQWDALLRVCHYFRANPTPRLYIRELPIQVPTKFIEENIPVLTSLLDFLLPGYVQADAKEFRRRFNLRYDEPLLRLRILDPALARTCFSGLDDLSIPLSQFNALRLACARVFILENKTNFSNIFNFLTLPQLEGSVAVFGEGFKLHLLGQAAWLRDKKIYYWGDIDAHGFEILSVLRGFFPQTRSFLMDAGTFRTFKKYAVKGPDFYRTSLPHLTPEETHLFYHLLQLEDHNRLEQERIPQDYVLRGMNALPDA